MSTKLNNLIYRKTVYSTLFLLILVAAFITVSPQVFPQNSNKTVVLTETKDLPRFLLQVGISKYKYVRQLKGTENDIKDLQSVLQQRFSTAGQKWQTVQLINEQATHEAIEKAFKAHLIENAKKNPNAIVIFQYSGHGSQVVDTNGDESDGLDETLVPIDSRDPQNKVFDITDDKLNEWFQELSKFTSNITFILDSCHSGTGTRGDEAIRNVETDTRPQPKQNNTNRGDTSGLSDIPNADILRANNNYVTISAALNNETASEIKVTEGTEVKHRGALTYYLVEALKNAAPETTYRQLMERVSAAVNQRKPQHPQTEGDIGRAVFGGTASSEEPFIKINKVEGKKIIIEAGESLGIKKGTPLAVYSADTKEAPNLKGEKGKLANATVTKVDAFTAEAEMSAENSKINRESRAVLVSPHFGTEPLKVLDNTATRDKPSSLPENLFKELEEKNLVQIVPIGNGKGSVSPTDNNNLLTIKRGLYGNVFSKANTTSNKKATEPDDEIYYFDENEDDKPEFGFYLKTSDTELVTKLAEALESVAKQHNLRSLSNNAAPSEIAGKIKLTVLAVKLDEKKEKITETKELSSNTTDYLFEQGSYFQIKIENLSKIPLYITLFDISTDSSIKTMYPPEGSRDALAPGKSVLTPVYGTTAPAGSETIKAIATTTYANFSILTQKGINQRNVSSVESPIGWLMNKALGKTTRGLVEEDTKLDAWVTTNINFRISDKVKK